MPSIVETIESLDYERLTYDEDGSAAFTTGSCCNCDTEPVPILLITEQPDHPISYVRRVCIRCGQILP